MDLQDLRCFIRVAETESLSGASRMMAVPKSTLSRALCRLEDEIGAKLFERSTRALRLTEAGLMLLPHARRIIDDFEDARAALDGVSGQPCGMLRINAAMTFALGLVAPMIPDFLRQFPEIRVHLQTENRIVDVAREDVDVAIRIGALEDSDLIARRLGIIALWPCASPAYLRQHGIPETPSDLSSHTLLGWTDHPETWRFTNVRDEIETIPVPVGSVVPEPAVLKILLESDVGVGRLPDFLARNAIEAGLLVRLLPDFETETVEAHAVYAAHRSLSSKVRVFIDALHAHLAHEAGRAVKSDR
ncbi:LysR family transcriptional regulator [Gluconobacter roseus]|uniref:LysR family transcriptional regulator n=1 Tax=Gluconobacter roseus NBRC 3990 TaxID=1307950 RepID=A0A4Y3M2B8_9PROT|nr:LysR family transcriptional regulator [Gluconobacter roseus]KXV44374.1 LysR family transcriptional regulator [Gluconobacter roseus]GBR48083.1 LysR family transcriptional regulator [Gluconobacter roseus NBRC 3990]GEB03420.1 LysR family transcriptional regulator [Gluconobacter roseus NBRC 3990]GLP93878.1 LysR family transcriptional regulator [Gluconobacter roseus NBRC 3990]